MLYCSPVTLPTPTRSAQNNSMWTLTSPDGSRVERYIVEFECSVRNITFVEKYMSVSASGGTGRVATSVSCFGGLGQLYRVQVWAVSGPNISPTLVCIPDGQCREGEGGRDPCMHSSQWYSYNYTYAFRYGIVYSAVQGERCLCKAHNDIYIYSICRFPTIVNTYMYLCTT